MQSGCTCPNRDGTIGTGGCTFCSEGGSGDFAAPLLPIEEQIRLARLRVDAKIPASIPPEKRKYIAYFQSYTNTYGNTEKLRGQYLETIRRPEICLLSIGTRPDCLSDDKIHMLQELNAIKPVWVELGLQTIRDDIAAYIHRGYLTAVYDNAYIRLKKAGLTVITHVILGLPGETVEDMVKTTEHIAGLYRPHMKSKIHRQGFDHSEGEPTDACVQLATSVIQRDVGIRTDGIKLQLLHVLKGTVLAEEYAEHPFRVMTLEEYTDAVIRCLRVLPEETVVHRITGDGPKKLLIEPQWSADKKRALNTLNRAIAID